MKIKIINIKKIGNVQRILFFPNIIINEVIKPSHAFREFVRNAAKPINIKKDMLTINKLQKVNQENAMFDRVNPSLIRDTRKALKEMENKIRLNFRKTDQGKKNTEQNRIFRKFLKEQKQRKDTFTDDGTPYGGRDFS